MGMREARAAEQWRKVGTFGTITEGGQRLCTICGTRVHSYQYRFHPPESSLFERCIGLAWCAGCRVYCGSMVHVSRETVLEDALASLPRDRCEHLQRSETALLDYLDSRTHDSSAQPGR
ncbi:hypothetical protein [Streptomyces rimosus]|uniref:hypothetical protein n=1 Tax=Streptomyces rimosus TaxID=1927 RepID=UPI00131AAA24|nr:hypothetical protein [Streptomyces rimosus]